MFETPILFLIFNRPDTTALVFEQIKGVKPKHLFIAADGPRDNRPGEADLCKASRDIVLQGIDWECEVKTLFREVNLGCGVAPAKAINWFFDNVDQGIILEDDCLPDPSFFTYCELLLEKYKYDDRVLTIGGTNLGYTLQNGNSYEYSRFMNMWGWASWKRSAKIIDYSLLNWKKIYFKKLFLISRTHTGNSIDINWINYWQNYFDIVSSGNLDCWDYQWVFSQLLHRKISIFPAKNLIKNIGFTHNATHTVYPNHPIAHLLLQSLSFPLHHPKHTFIDKDYEEEFIKKIWCGQIKVSIFKIVKTKLLYIPLVTKLNRFIKKRV